MSSKKLLGVKPPSKYILITNPMGGHTGEYAVHITLKEAKKVLKDESITVYIFKTQKDSMDLYFNLNDESFQNIVNKSIIDENKQTIIPTTTNPFMNINLITSDKTQEKAPPSWNNEELQKKIEDNFGYNLYRDFGDLYGKSNSQREFYTMPSTTIPNNQTSFAKWLYNTGPTCKEKSTRALYQ